MSQGVCDRGVCVLGVSVRGVHVRFFLSCHPIGPRQCSETLNVISLCMVQGYSTLGSGTEA